MKVLKKIIKEAKYYAVPDEDDLEGQSEAILNMPVVQPIDVNIDDELDMIDDIETRAANLGSAYGDEVPEDETEDEEGYEGECEDEGECEGDEVYEITSANPICPCCGCKLVISDLPSESEEEAEEESEEEDVEEEAEEEDVEEVEDDEDDEDDDDVEVIEDDEDDEESEDDEDDDDVEVIEDEE